MDRKASFRGLHYPQVESIPLSARKPRLLITMGDPSGIGPEVTLRALQKLPSGISFSVIGDLKFLKGIARRHRWSVPWSRIDWVDLENLSKRVPRGQVSSVSGRAAWAYLQKAFEILQAGQASGLVTAPVSKEAIVRAKIPWVGHTEALAQAFDAPTTMMFVTDSFRVSLVTTHCALKSLTRVLTRSKVRQTLKATQTALRRQFGIRTPRIGLAALNPHAGEGGLFGEEERKILKPVLRGFAGRVKGPLSADSLMQQAAAGQLDAVVALYHDQALIPVKLLGWEQAVNVTLGLPFVRTSPVHGTAFDLAGTGQASAASMQAAIRLASQLVRSR